MRIKLKICSLLWGFLYLFCLFDLVSNAEQTEGQVVKLQYNNAIQIQNEEGTEVSINVDGEGNKTFSAEPGIYRYTCGNGADGFFEITEKTSEIDLREVSFNTVKPYVWNVTNPGYIQVFDEKKEREFHHTAGSEWEFVLPRQGGDSYYNFTYTPYDEKYLPVDGHFYVYRDTYFEALNLSDSGRIPYLQKKYVNIRVPKDTEVLTTWQLKFYTARNYQTYEYTVDGDYWIYENVPMGFTFMFRKEGYVTRYSDDLESIGTWDADHKVITIEELKENPHQIIRDIGDTGYFSSMMTNLPEDSVINLEVGEYFDLVPLRAWQAVSSIGGNDYNDPGWHYEVVKGGANIVSVEQTKDDEIGQFGRIKALKAGSAVVAFWYDAMETASSSDNDKNGLHTFGALWPELTGVAIVNVTEAGQEVSGVKITTNIDITEGRTLYYLKSITDAQGVKTIIADETGSEATAKYTFTPTAEDTEGNALPITSVKVNKIQLKAEDGKLNSITNNDYLIDSRKTNWKNVVSNGDGSYTLSLPEGRNVIKVSYLKNVAYHVIFVRGIDVVVDNLYNKGNPLAVGDTARIQLKGLIPPIFKMGAIYNPSGIAYECKANGKDFSAGFGQYMEEVSFNLPMTEEDEGTYVFSKGSITGASWGATSELHRLLTRNSMAGYWSGGDNPMIDYGKLADMPEFSFEVLPQEDEEENKARTAGMLKGLRIMPFNSEEASIYKAFWHTNYGSVPQNRTDIISEDSSRTYPYIYVGAYPLNDPENVKLLVRYWSEDDPSIYGVRQIPVAEIKSIYKENDALTAVPIVETKYINEDTSINIEVIVVPKDGDPMTYAYHIDMTSSVRIGLADLELTATKGSGVLGRNDGILETKKTFSYKPEGSEEEVTQTFGYGYIGTQTEFSTSVPNETDRIDLTYSLNYPRFKQIKVRNRTTAEEVVTDYNSEINYDSFNTTISLNEGINSVEIECIPYETDYSQKTAVYKVDIVRRPAKKQISFSVLDGETLLDQASVTVLQNGKKQKANETDAYTFALEDGNYTYYVSRPGYEVISADFNVNGQEGTRAILVPGDRQAWKKLELSEGEVTVRIAGQQDVYCPTRKVRIESPEEMLDLAKKSYVQYNHGGYTVLHALIDACNEKKLSFNCRNGILIPRSTIDSESLGADAGWVCEVNGSVVTSEEIANTLVKADDKIEYYYNSDYVNMLRAWLTPERDEMERRNGESVTLTLYGKKPGEPDDKAKVLSDIGIYEGNKLIATTNDDGQAVISSDMFSTLGSHYLTARKEEGGKNILTATLSMVTLLQDSGYEAAPGKVTVSFRLIGDTKHGGENPSEHKYTTWIKTQEHTFEVEDINTPSVTVGMVFKKALEEANLTYVGLEDNYIKSITAPATCGDFLLEEFSNGKNSGWMYTINGVHPGKGVNEQYVEPGDEIIFHYIDDYKTEEADRLDGDGGGNASTWNKWLEAEDETPGAREKAQVMANHILEAGSADAVMPEQEELIRRAREEYDALSREEKSYVSEEAYTLLIDAEHIIQILKDSKAEAAAITELIRSLPGEIQKLQDKINADTTQTDAEETDTQAEGKSGSTGSSLRAKASGCTAVSGRAALSVQSAASRNAYRNMRTYRNTDAYHAYGSFRAMSVSAPVTVPDNGEVSDGTDGSKESGSSDGNDDGGDPDGAGEADEPGDSDASEDTDGSEDKTDTDIVKETPDREETAGSTDNAEADTQTEEEIFAAIKAVHEKVTEARLRYNRLNGIAKRLIAEETLQTLVTAENELQALMEKQGADARILKEEIAALPDLDSLTPDDADAVDAVEKAVLHYTVWKDVDTKLTLEEIARCEAAKAAIEKLRNDEKDKEAAREVEAVLNALPQAETPLLSWKRQAEAARKAYDGLTADQQKWVPSELVERLTALEAKLNELETQAKEAKALLEALPPADQVTLEHAQQIEAAKAAYDALSTDQRQLIKKDLSERLTEVTAVLNNLNMEEAGKVLDLIHALPKAEDLTLSHREALEAARKAYDALNEAQKTIFAQDAEGLKTLEALEAKMIVLKEMDYKFIDRIVGLGVGQKAVMTITKGNDPQAVAVTWTSLNPKVATVDESGTVTGVAEGQAKIKATVPADGAEIIGTVNVYPEAPVRIQRGAETLKVGETDRITVTYVPETMGTGATVGYVSSNEELLTVDADGVVTAVGYAGDSTVTVTAIVTLADDTRIRETLRYTILPKPEDPGSDSLILYAVKGLDTVLKDIKLPEGFTWISDEATELDQFFGRETRFSAKDADGNEITVRVRTASFTASFTKLPEKIGTGLEASEIQAAYRVKGVSQEELAKILEERNLHLTWTFTGMPAGKAEISEIDETAGTAKIRGISPASMTVEATLNADGSLLAKDSRKVTVVDTKGQAAAQVDIRLTVNGEEVQPADGVYVLDQTAEKVMLEDHTQPEGNYTVTYKSSDASVVKIGKAAKGEAVTPVTLSKSGYAIVTATANDALRSTQEIRIRVTDRTEAGIRLSSDRITINLQKGGETLNVYNAFRGRLTKAEIDSSDFYAEAAGDETVRVSVKEGVESPKAGTVRLNVTVEGEGTSLTKAFDLKIAVVNQKPSVTVRQLTNADPFAGKDAKFAIGASGETIEAVLFGTTVELEESDTEDGVWILPARYLTDGTNKGTITIRLDGYKDAAEKKNVTVKTESPALTLSASSGVVYTKGTDVAFGTMQVRILDKKTKAGYDLSGLEAGALTVDAGYQAEVTDEENGLIEITADKAPAGSQKLTLTLTGANGTRKTLGFTVKKADIRKAALQLENRSLTLYDYGDLGSTETEYQVYTGLTLKGCGALPEDVAESLEIKNAADDSDVDYVNYDPKTGQIAVKVKGGMITGTENYKVSVTLPKEAFGSDDNGNPWLSKNLKAQLKLKLVRTEVNAKNLIKKVAVKGKIDVLDRSASGLTLTPSFKNLTTGAKVTDVRLTGEDAHLFKIAERKENGVVLVQVRPGENVVTKKAYRFGAAYTIVSGGQTITVATDSAKDGKPYLKVKLTQGKVKAAANGSGSFDNAGGSAPLTFVLTNRSGRRLNVDTERVELTNFTKDFGYDAQNGVLTYHPSGQTASGRSYTLKFKVHTVEGGGNEKPITVKYKVKIAK